MNTTYTTWHEAIIRVLGDCNKPLKATEIAMAIVDNKYYITSGRTPERTISSYLTENLKGYYVSPIKSHYMLSDSGITKYRSMIQEESLKFDQAGKEIKQYSIHHISTIHINQKKLKELINCYKADFKTNINNELYKWRAVAHFQKHWDINSTDFKSMLELALGFKDDNLLAGNNYFPKGMLSVFCDFDPEYIKRMFINLFDESQDLADRINNFASSANDLKLRWNPEKNHYQDYRAISTYLWLMFPDKYFIYKSDCIKALVSLLEFDYSKQNKLKGQNVVNAYDIYSQVAEAMMQDAELRSMLNTALDEECYNDPMARTLVVDFAYYLNKYYKNSIHINDKEMVNDEKGQHENVAKKSSTYTKSNFLNEVYISELEYEDLCGVLNHKKSIILQGAPGVGKTFAAKRLAYSIMGERDDERIGFVQFHQNYSYEDFVMGYKPNSEGGFDLQRGIFHRFCTKAANDPSRKYFFIIDEINRGNLSKIFGELLMLVEKDYRFDYAKGEGTKISLAYSEESFAVPDNLYIIGMMNTADRSLAMIDYALRRRFGFYPMKPGFESDGFKQYQADLGSEKFDALIAKIKELNETIISDPSLGNGFEIGHSYFCNKESMTDEWLQAVVNYEIIPMLEEYWFDNKENVSSWSEKLRSAIK